MTDGFDNDDKRHSSPPNDRDDDRADSREYEKKDRKKTPAKGKKRKGSGGKSNFALFYVITMIVGIIVCVALFAIAYQSLVPDRITGTPNSGQQANPVDFVRPVQEQVLGMVTGVSTSGTRSLTLLILETGRTEQFTTTETTGVQNRFGSPIGFGELNLGQIVEVTFDANTQEMSAISLSGRAWNQQHRGSVNINLESATITIGNQVYTYSSRTLVLNQNQPFSIALVNPNDVLTLWGYGDKVWSITVDTGHGFIRFENADRVVNGTVAIGNSIFTPLEGSDAISALEGTHRVIIDGRNIETFIADVVVRQSETIVVNLMDVTFRTGTLQLVINDSDTSVFINGDAVELVNSLVEVEYGTHMLRLERPGFLPVQQEFEMSQPFMRLEVDLPRGALLFQVIIETFPSNSQVFLDGVFQGNSPLTLELEQGTYQVIARRAGYEDRAQNVFVGERASNQVLLQLTQLPNHLLPSPSPTPSATTPPEQEVLPPLPPGWAPIPTPTLPPSWDPPLPDDIFQQPVAPVWPPDPPENILPETLPGEVPWPPLPEHLPLPPGF
ncbi:MAG: PEGA domain-containing protein [Defluviitaleaceae bacterium]|nr:PEGA domain-containing protein [Defluviitaleaceae bacterium]